MNLKKKLMMLLLVSGLILALILYLGFRFTMEPSLNDQKEIYIKKMQKKIQVALSIEADNIALLCNDWTDWENLKMYLEHPVNEKELEANVVMPDEMLTEGMMDLVVVFDLEQHILFYKNFVPSKGFIGLKSGGIPSGIKRIDREIRGKVGSVKGTIITPYGPLLFVANPILDGNRSTRRKGVLLMGRYVAQGMLDRFSSYTVEKIQTLPYDQLYLVNTCTRLGNNKDMLYSESDDKITVFHVLKDINNTPAVILFTETDNRIFRVLDIHITFIVITMSLVFLLGLLLYFSIDRYLLKRMLAISESMGKIEGFEGLSIRIDNDNQKDEVSHLISNINLTLDRLEQEKVKRENAEKGLIKQGKLASIGRLTSSIAHEINNPLMAISTSIQVIKKIGRDNTDAFADPSLFGEAVEISESEVERIRDIISGLLDFHRLDKEGFTRVNLKDVVLQSLSILSWSKKLELIETVLELEDNVFIYCAPVKVKQVLINFILNAAEAMRGGDRNKKENPGNKNGNKKGKLKIMVVPPTASNADQTGRQFAEIHLIDNGPGLPPQVKRTLFEPFVTTKEDKGVGLGLYISYKIIEQHDGEIIYDENCQEGTHFIIRLPMDRRKEERIILSPIPTF